MHWNRINSITFSPVRVSPILPSIRLFPVLLYILGCPLFKNFQMFLILPPNFVYKYEKNDL